VQLLKERQDISEEEVDQIVTQLESSRDSVLTTAQEHKMRRNLKPKSWASSEAYLRDTNKEELNLEGIKRDLQSLLEDPQAGLSALRSRLNLTAIP